MARGEIELTDTDCVGCETRIRLGLHGFLDGLEIDCMIHMLAKS
jgi:hypothetical protein